LLSRAFMASIAEVTLSKGFFDPPADDEEAGSVLCTVILPSRSIPFGTPNSCGVDTAGCTADAALRTTSSSPPFSSLSSSSSPSVLCVFLSRFLAASRSASRPMYS
jgi:hypothetical protein